MAILDSDDAYDPRRLEALAHLAAARPDLDLVTTDARFVLNGEPVGRFVAHNPFDVEDQRTAIIRSCFVGGWPAVRLASLRAIGGFDETLRTGLDWDCWLRLILNGSQAGLVNEPYYDYRLHGGSLTANRVSSLWDRVRVLEKASLNPALRPEEHRVLRRTLRGFRTRAVGVETQAELARRGSPRRLLSLAFSNDINMYARVGAALAVVSPPLARRFIVEDQPPGEQRFAKRRQ
jgi:hypothetical protein